VRGDARPDRKTKTSARVWDCSDFGFTKPVKAHRDPSGDGRAERTGPEMSITVSIAPPEAGIA
jgi:hypothetical protein